MAKEVWDTPDPAARKHRDPIANKPKDMWNK